MNRKLFALVMAFVSGYRRFIASNRRAFKDEVDLEMGVKKEPHKQEINLY